MRTTRKNKSADEPIDVHDVILAFEGLNNAAGFTFELAPGAAESIVRTVKTKKNLKKVVEEMKRIDITKARPAVTH